MSSSISDLLPDSIDYHLDKFIEEKETKLKEFKEAYDKYFEAEDKLRKFMKDKKISKRIAITKIPLKFALNLPCRDFEEDETYNMDVFKYEDPVTKEYKLVILPHLKKEEEEEKKEEETTIKENIIQAINL